MLLEYNILKHYEVASLAAYKELRRWGNADNKQVLTTFKNAASPENNYPPFAIVTDTSATSGTVQLYDTDDATVSSAPTITIAALDPAVSGYKLLKYAGKALTGQADGCYYYKIVLNTGEIIYSEVFEWKTDVSDLVKVEATNDNITIAGTYNVDMSSLTFISYYDSEFGETALDIQEKGVEKPFGVKPTFNTRNLINSLEVFGTRDIFVYLSGLRILEVNGDVAFTYNNVEMTAYDITVEKKESFAFDEVTVITIEFKETNYISSRNAI